MATLNDLGRNSAAITYGPSSTGADIMPTLALVDKWLRNDTWQGTATVSGNVITGASSIYTTQARAGDIIQIGQQTGTISAVNSDSNIVLTACVATNVSSASSIRVIGNTLSGTVAITVRGTTTGTVAVQNGNSTIIGTGTSFTTEATNSSSANTTGRIITINGRRFQITGFNSDTSMVVSPAPDFTDAGIPYKVEPRGTIAIVANANSVTGTNTVLNTDTSAGDLVWIGDELRTITASTATAAVIGLPTFYNYAGSSVTYASSGATANGKLPFGISGVALRTDSSIITGTDTAFTTELRVGDELIIAGVECTVAQIISDTVMRINIDFPKTITGVTAYKKKKLHGYVLEGIREGGGLTAVQYKWATQTTMATAANTVALAGATTVVVASNTNVVANGPIRISAAGGPSVPLTGTANALTASTTLNASGTLFTSELHVGAEIMVAGQYLTVTAIANNTSLTTKETIAANTDTGHMIYRTTPLYTYANSTPAGTTVAIATALKNNIYSTGSNPPQIAVMGTGADFVEYVYSAPNKTAEASTTLFNTSLDRKYVGFRFFPLYQNTNTAVITATTANCAYSTPVYERWVGGWNQGSGVGVNQADLSGGTVFTGTVATTALTVTSVPAGQLVPGMTITDSLGNISSQTTTYTGFNGSYTVTGAITNATANSVFSATTINGTHDLTPMTQVGGGFIYLYATPRYAAVQGKSFSNIQQPLLGCFEFERSQPEDLGGTSGGATGAAYYGTLPISYQANIAPWPTYGYINSNRFPVGAAAIPTAPSNVTVAYTSTFSVNNAIHGSVISVPRVRSSTGDLVGLNAHTYSACVITTGRWGHVHELAAAGSYLPATASANAVTNTNAILQPHMGSIVPVYTNVYNSKRFMFSPIVVLGPIYDPDIRGRIYGLKVLPSGLGTLMDTVSVTVDSNYFYDSGSSAADHWVVTSPGSTAAKPGNVSNTGVVTTRVPLGSNTSPTVVSWRSLEDTNSATASTVANFTNNFRFALPA